MQQYYLGINLGHERSVAIVKDGKIVVAIEQERLDRHKHSVGFLLHAPGDTSQIQIPHESIRYCLDSCGIALTDLACITPNMPGHDFAPEIVKRAFPAEIAQLVVPVPSHHLAHAYSAFWPSGFDDAIVLVVDATGSTTAAHCTESYTLYAGHEATLKLLYSETIASHLAGLSTLGFIYEYITRKAGFVTSLDKTGCMNHAEAGKLMGLAPFGSEQSHLHRWIRPINNSYHLQISAYDIFLEVAALEKRYDTRTGKPYLRPYLVDLAYKVQQELELALLHLVALAMKQTGLRKLCIAGGVGLNSVANYKLLQQLDLEDIFIFPAAGDNGIAAGCALWAYHTVGGGKKRSKLKQANLGHQYSHAQVTQALKQFDTALEVEELSSSEVIARSAQKLAQGQIVARFEGRSEYGPRALGQRSIMVDPTFPQIKDILNARVKFREAFRPFAPVVPLEKLNEIFELEVADPFMLVVPPIKSNYQAQLPAVTHVDGTGRVQTVTKAENPYFYQICWSLAQVRGGPPVLLNTSFNIAGQPIVETPAEAIQTFLQTDIDYLVIENFWISKRQAQVPTYAEQVQKLTDTPVPQGLPPGVPAVTALMERLDRALFWGETHDCPWTTEELQALSAEGARYKETSVLFPSAPFPVQSQLSTNILLLLNPLGKSQLVDLTQQVLSSSYTFAELKLLMMVFEGPEGLQEQMKMELRLTHAELEQRLDWAHQQLSHYNLEPKAKGLQIFPPDSIEVQKNSSSETSEVFSEIDEIEKTLAPFAEENFCLYHALGRLRQCLQDQDYKKSTICTLLEISSLQQLEPTYFHYYDRYKLPNTPLGDLIRLFLLQGSLSQAQLQTIFGPELFAILVKLGVLIPQAEGNQWLSRIDLYEIENLYLATDHRYMVRPEDKFNEEPVMYVGSDSMGLVYTAPQFAANRVLDLCCGCGIQGLVASRYAKEVMSVDINLRAIRFARFNAQLNGIRNIHFLFGNLYEPVQDYDFDAILANPPFVAAPKNDCRFRDGGGNGEIILAQIIQESTKHLTPNGKLFLVTDLIDVENYQAKLEQWWGPKPAHKIVFCTADRDEILFSIPHCHVPFEQSFAQYNLELEQWVDNFRTTSLKSINFGYILINCLPESKTGSYYMRTIHNPNHPIHQQVQNYFKQRELLENMDNQRDLFLVLSGDIHFRIEDDGTGNQRKIEIFSPSSQYFTTYQLSEQVYGQLQDIQRFQPKWQLYVTPQNQEILKDLIYKGIIYLSCKCPQTVNTSSVSQKPIQTHKMNIVEMKTKTTPTCLSSYLNVWR
jgi:carbamoyltransferase